MISIIGAGVFSIVIILSILIICGLPLGELTIRVQEKVGFIYHHTCENVPVPLMNEVRIGHTNVLTKAHWEEICV